MQLFPLLLTARRSFLLTIAPCPPGAAGVSVNRKFKPPRANLRFASCPPNMLREALHGHDTVHAAARDPFLPASGAHGCVTMNPYGISCGGRGRSDGDDWPVSDSRTARRFVLRHHHRVDATPARYNVREAGPAFRGLRPPHL